MNILINASDLKAGGGIQVADSICTSIIDNNQHYFVIVLSSFLNNTRLRIKELPNVKVVTYDLPKCNIYQFITGRNSFLDALVTDNKIDIVLSVFGPSLWRAKCPMLVGFALAHIVMPESPYFRKLSKYDFIKNKIKSLLWLIFFKLDSKYFYTENENISKRLADKIDGATIYTITNYYNQVFDNPQCWVIRQLPEFDGCTLINISSFYPHKNLEITIDITRYLIEHHPDFKFRFVLTIDEDDFPPLEDNISSHFVFTGKVDIAECPSLYEQSDIAFQSTLLECFTATYPEAMRMKVPIVTTDLSFAKGLCGEAAMYYDALNPADAAEVIVKVYEDKDLQSKLVSRGLEQLKIFDTYSQRTSKIIKALEDIVDKNK